jgi:hypothetical protein
MTLSVFLRGLWFLLALAASIVALRYRLYDWDRGGWQIGPGYNGRGFKIFFALLFLSFACIAAEIYLARLASHG